MSLSILEVWYIIGIFFTVVIGTLLTIVLVKVIKILGPITEIIEFYEKIKTLFSIYANVPGVIISKITGRKNKSGK